MIVDVLWRYHAVQLFFTRWVVTNSCSPTAIWTPTTRICCSADSVCVSHSHRSRSSWIPTQTWPETWWAVFKSRYSVARGIDHLISVVIFILPLFLFLFVTLIVHFVLLQITKDSIGPKHICNECYDRVQDWVMFKKQSEEALKEIDSNSDFVEREVCL